MIKISTRPLSDVEKKQLKSQQPTVYKKVEDFMLKTIYIFLILLAPILVIDHFWQMPSTIEAITLIGILPLTLLFAYKITQNHEGGFSNKKNLDSINKGQAEIIHVQTSRAIKIEDYDDFGLAFYLEVQLNQEQKVLYLWGQYLDELVYEKRFPNTEFEIVREFESKQILDVKLMGKFFAPERILPPFDAQTWKSGKFPMDGDLLDRSMDEIKKKRYS